MPIWLIVLIAIGVVALWLWATYNRLITSNEQVGEAWSDITVQLKRRYDLIPNIINAVKGYVKHEKGVFEQVTKARAEALKADSVPATAKAENQFQQALRSLFAVAEDYPDLKANENFKHLQEELVDTEDKIQAARRFYNGAARDLNVRLKIFPTNLIARSLGFTKRDFFEVADQATVEKPVEVNL